MSMLNRPADASSVGETVASVREYEAAQKTVSKLIAGEVPARDIAIVGQGVRSIERVTGKLGYATAARSGAVNGVLIGLLLSAILVLGHPEAPIQLFVGFVFIGVALGMILSLISYAIVRRRRDFASVTQLAADHYEVTVLPASLAKAREIVGVQRTTVVRPPVDLDEPPKYGERVAPGAEQAPAVAAAGGPVIPPRPADPRPRYGEMAPDAGAPATPAAAEPDSATDPGAESAGAPSDTAAEAGASDQGSSSREPGAH